MPHNVPLIMRPLVGIIARMLHLMPSCHLVGILIVAGANVLFSGGGRGWGERTFSKPPARTTKHSVHLIYFSAPWQGLKQMQEGSYHVGTLHKK